MRELKLVDPLQIHGTVSPASPDTLGPRVLELTGLLQTTLEIDKLIELFARELRRSVELDGLGYTHATEQLEIKLAEVATHRARYDLTLADEALGRLSVYRELPFQPDELHTLENLLCALVYPLRNALSYRRAVQLALRDPLTGAQNRAALEQSLTREVELARRQGNPLSLLVFDIDHFKAFNDAYGHSFGDDVLKAITAAADATIRRSDLLFRYGGEEFVVLASHTDAAGALQLAERIRRNIEHLQAVAGRPVRLTISVGAATLASGEQPKAFFDRADQALYRAKQNGRNRTETSS
jgi:diguanylate cyclase (GGDEF)-like protein